MEKSGEGVRKIGSSHLRWHNVKTKHPINAVYLLNEEEINDLDQHLRISKTVRAIYDVLRQNDIPKLKLPRVLGERLKNSSFSNQIEEYDVELVDVKVKGWDEEVEEEEEDVDKEITFDEEEDRKVSKDEDEDEFEIEKPVISVESSSEEEVKDNNEEGKDRRKKTKKKKIRRKKKKKNRMGSSNLFKDWSRDSPTPSEFSDLENLEEVEEGDGFSSSDSDETTMKIRRRKDDRMTLKEDIDIEMKDCDEKIKKRAFRRLLARQKSLDRRYKSIDDKYSKVQKRLTKSKKDEKKKDDTIRGLRKRNDMMNKELSDMTRGKKQVEEKEKHIEDTIRRRVSDARRTQKELHQTEISRMKLQQYQKQKKSPKKVVSSGKIMGGGFAAQYPNVANQLQNMSQTMSQGGGNPMMPLMGFLGRTAQQTRSFRRNNSTPFQFGYPHQQNRMMYPPQPQSRMMYPPQQQLPPTHLASSVPALHPQQQQQRQSSQQEQQQLQVPQQQQMQPQQSSLTHHVSPVPIVSPPNPQQQQLPPTHHSSSVPSMSSLTHPQQQQQMRTIVSPPQQQQMQPQQSSLTHHVSPVPIVSPPNPQRQQLPPTHHSSSVPSMSSLTHPQQQQPTSVMAQPRVSSETLIESISIQETESRSVGEKSKRDGGGPIVGQSANKKRKL